MCRFDLITKLREHPQSMYILNIIHLSTQCVVGHQPDGEAGYRHQEHKDDVECPAVKPLHGIDPNQAKHDDTNSSRHRGHSHCFAPQQCRVNLSRIRVDGLSLEDRYVE